MDEPVGNRGMASLPDRKLRMKPVRAFFLSMIMLSGIALWGAGIYTADASAHLQVVDGYGVSASR